MSTLVQVLVNQMVCLEQVDWVLGMKAVCNNRKDGDYLFCTNHVFDINGCIYLHQWCWVAILRMINDSVTPELL